MKFKGKNFKLQFDESEFPKWVESYNQQPENLEKEALNSGKEILKGNFCKHNLEKIIRWKSNRTLKKYSENSDKDIADALSLALSAKTDRSAIAVLKGLKGVEVAMASAIMAACYPLKFTIIDFRALQSLGIFRFGRRPNYIISIDEYLIYLDFCRNYSERLTMSLRDFDRGIWKYSKDYKSSI